MGSRYHRARSRSPPPSPPQDGHTEAPYVFRRPHYYHIEPLINRIENNWIDEKNIVDDEPWFPHHPDNDDHEHYPDLCDIDNPTPARVLRRLWVRSYRLRKILSLLLLIYIIIELVSTLWVSPFLAEDMFWKAGLDKEWGNFGIQAPSGLAHVTMAAEIDPKYLPGGPEDPQGKKRLVFVGDIHGCNEELRSFLKAVSFDPDNDHLIHTGDVLAKGPDAAGVIDTLIALNADGVRGNWEDRVLTAASALNGQERFRPLANVVSENVQNKRRPSKESAILAELKPHHVRYLAHLPLVLTIPEPTFPKSKAPKQSLGEYSPPVPNAASHHSRISTPLRDPIFVVHAGLVPAVPLQRQDPLALLTMRYLHPTTHLPTPEPLKGSEPWIRAWNWYQRRLARGIPRPRYAYVDAEVDPKFGFRGQSADGHWEWRSLLGNRRGPPPRKPRGSEDFFAALGWGAIVGQQVHDPIDDPTMVVYGHNARAGVNVDEYTMGLDGGCVSGGRLTGFVLDAWGRREMVSVRCRNYLAADTEETTL